jgi:hypothetical protein
MMAALQSLSQEQQRGYNRYLQDRLLAEKARIAGELAELSAMLGGSRSSSDPPTGHSATIPEVTDLDEAEHWYSQLPGMSPLECEKLHREMKARSESRLQAIETKIAGLPLEAWHHDSEWSNARARLQIKANREREHQRLLSSPIIGNQRTRTYHRVNGCHVPSNEAQRFYSVYVAWAFGFAHCKDCGESFSPKRGYAHWGSRLPERR